MKLIADLNSKSWLFDFNGFDLYSDYADIFISFTNGTKRSITFSNLSFGLDVLFNENVIGGDSFPKGNAKYVETDQEYLESVRIIGFRPNRTFYFNVWAENDGFRFEDNIEVFIPIPEQPYPSWTWDDDVALWQPPFLPPDEDKIYDWDEDNQVWIPR